MNDQPPARLENNEGELEIVLLSYQLAMEAERGFFTTGAVVLGVAGASLAALVSVTGTDQAEQTASAWIWVLVPFVPILALAFLVHQAAMGTARGPYLLALEDRLRSWTGVEVTMRSGDITRHIGVPMYHRLMLPLVSRRRAIGFYALLWGIANILTGVLVLAILLVALSQVWEDCVLWGILVLELAIASFLLAVAARTLLGAPSFSEHIWGTLPEE